MISLSCTVLSYLDKESDQYKKIRHLSIVHKLNLINCADIIDFTSKLMNLKPNVIIVDMDGHKVPVSTFSLLNRFCTNIEKVILLSNSEVFELEKDNYITIRHNQLSHYFEDNIHSWKFAIAINKKKEKSVSQKQLCEINSFLYALSFSPKHRGYNYLKEILCQIITNNGEICSLNNDYYPLLSSIFKTNSCNIERAIRSSIEYAWNNANQKIWYDTFRHNMFSSNIKPSNREFICLCAEKLLNNF